MKKIYTRLLALASAALLALSLAGCAGNNNTLDNAGNNTQSADSVSITAVSTRTSANDISVKYSDADETDTWGSDATVITLSGDTAAVTGSGASAEGAVVTVDAAGSYVISGALNDGQIVVDASDDATVHLVLSGASVSSSAGAVIDILSADKVVITLAEGTDNTVTNAAEPSADGSMAAAIDSRDDLSVNGSGSLTVNAASGAGIKCNDDLKIMNGTIEINCAGDALKGQDSVNIKNGTLTLNAGADGIESTNAEEEGRGNITVEDGTLTITAALDGIQAAASLLISGGELHITSGGGSANSSQKNEDWGQWPQGGQSGQQSTSEAQDSAKGVKSAGDISVTGGTLILDSSDDSVHANGSISVSGGTIEAASGDDGIHADTALSISGGEVTVSQSYEGIESTDIGISGGTIHITASDDGVNTSGGSDSSAMGRPGENAFSESGAGSLSVSGGYVYVNAAGDGIDANGAAQMTGGTVLVCGPEDARNGALDFASFAMDGGLLIAAGSTGMALLPDDTSAQNSIGVAFDSTLNPGTLVSLVSSDGTEILSFAPAKTFQTIVISSPDITTGGTYTVYTGCSHSGTCVDGLYSGGSVTGGSEAATVTVSSAVTSSGSFSQPMGDGPGGGMGDRPGGGPKR